jgi:hypothetical protein
MLQAATRRHVVLLARDAAHAERLQQPQRDVPGKDNLSLKLVPEAGGSRQTAKGRESEATSGCKSQRWQSGPLQRPLSARLPRNVASAPTQDSTCHGTNAAARRPASARASCSAPPSAAVGGGGDMLNDSVDTGRLLAVSRPSCFFFPPCPLALTPRY